MATRVSVSPSHANSTRSHRSPSTSSASPTTSTSTSTTPHSHRSIHHHPRFTPAHWHASLGGSPQLREELVQAGVNVVALKEYAKAARSKNVPLSQLSEFTDPKPRGSTMVATSNLAPSSSASFSHSSPNPNSNPSGDWNVSRNLDWKLLNGSRELTLLCTETALAHPDTEAGRLALERLNEVQNGASPSNQRTTDPHTGHVLNYILPTKQRFVEDAYYARIIDLRKSQEGRAPEKRLPPPHLYNGTCFESEPKDDAQRLVVAQHHAAQQARMKNLEEKTRHRYGIVDDPSIKNTAEWVNTQTKKSSIHGCPSASENTYNRLFHLDAPPPGSFIRSPAQLEREQHLRDRSSHGRAYEPIGNTLIQVIPVSKDAQLKHELSGPNAIGRARMDQRNAEREHANMQQAV